MKLPGFLLSPWRNHLCSLEVIPVSAHVSVEVSRLRKSRVTDFTLVGLLSGVGPVVFCQSGAVGKALSAHVAFVGAFTRVRSHVCRHGGTLRKASVANGTLEGFLPAMGTKVSGQIGCLRERLLAY